MAAQSQPIFRRSFLIAAWVWIGANVVLSLVGWLFALGDSPVTGTTHITLIQVLWDSGTIISPPLIFMVVAGLILWGATSGRLWPARVGTGLLAIGIALIAWDTHGGLNTRPS
jgi:hypothetical protein